MIRPLRWAGHAVVVWRAATVSRRRRRGLYLVVAAVIAVVVVVGRDAIHLDDLIARETAVRDVIGAHPATGLAIGLVVYVALSLIPGTAGKAIVAGWLYGFVGALVIVNIGLTIAAVITFLLSRFLFRELVVSRSGLYLRRIERALQREGVYVVLVLRLMHAPFSFTNYLLGATGMRTFGFWWSTQLGMLPGNAVFVYAGSQLPSLEVALRQGPSSVWSTELIAAFAIIATFPLLVRVLIKRYFATTESDPVSGGGFVTTEDNDQWRDEQR